MRNPSVTTPPLLAVAHGSRDPWAGAVVDQLLGAVARRRPGLTVVTSYLDHAPPTPLQALGGLVGEGVDEAVVLPLLLTAAYHSRTDIPRALRAARSTHPQLQLHYTAPLGPHPALFAALERRLAEVGVAAGDPETAVVLVSAGSSDVRASAVIEDLAHQWAGRGWWAVEPAYASAARPTPAEAVTRLRAAGAPRVVVAPYLLAPGYFATKVRKECLAAGASVVAGVLGAAPEVATIVLERYTAAICLPSPIAHAG